MSGISDVDINDWDKSTEIELREFKENPDGSADCILSVSSVGMKFLVNFAVIELFKKAIEMGKAHTPPDEEGTQ